MLAFLRTLFTDQPHAGAHATYIALVTRARNPFFYGAFGVPDTLDGRFELILLHLFLLQHRIKTGGQGGQDAKEQEEFARSLSELFFRDMDRSLREMGVADTGVRYRIKAMAKAYHGRLQAYATTLHDPQTLRAALARNLFGTVADGSVEMLDSAADYMQQMVAALDAADTETITRGNFAWPQVEQPA